MEEVYGELVDKDSMMVDAAYKEMEGRYMDEWLHQNIVLVWMMQIGARISEVVGYPRDL